MRMKMKVCIFATGLGLSSAAVQATEGIVNTLSSVDPIFYDAIGDYILENSLCLDQEQEILPKAISSTYSPERTEGIVNTLFTISDLYIIGESKLLYGEDFDPEDRPYTAFVPDYYFRKLLGNLLTTRDKNIALNYKSMYYSLSSRFYLINYENVLGVAVFFKEGNISPVLLMSGDMRAVADPEVLDLSRDVLRRACLIKK